MELKEIDHTTNRTNLELKLHNSANKPTSLVSTNRTNLELKLLCGLF